MAGENTTPEQRKAKMRSLAIETGKMLREAADDRARSLATAVHSGEKGAAMTVAEAGRLIEES